MRWIWMTAALVITAAAGIAAVVFDPAAADDGRYRFAVDVSLSPKAAQALELQQQGLVVFAFWEGLPIASKMHYASDDGVIGLGNEEIHFPGRRVMVSGKSIDRKHVAWVKDLMVLINVYSAGRPGQDNLLDCGSLEISAAKAQRKPVAISCKLISETEG